jgi:ribosomal 50S subunit-recycling heat shock protein
VRIDRVLHWLCLQKSRSLAARECRASRILLNGESTRPSRDVHPGDRITILDCLSDREEIVRILEVPQNQLSRKDARTYYETCQERGTDRNGAPLSTEIPPSGPDEWHGMAER